MKKTNSFIQKRIMSVILTLAVLLMMTPVWSMTAVAAELSGEVMPLALAAADSFANGDGESEETAYEISTPQELILLAEKVNAGDTEYNSAYYRLTQDIDLGGSTNPWAPIGSFHGIFDGGGHEISGLYIRCEAGNVNGYQGLFGVVSGGTVKNLTVSGEITASRYVGGIAGIIQKNPENQEKATVSNCVNKCTITYVGGTSSQQGYIGGIVGSSSGSMITKCHNVGKISATDGAGGRYYQYIGGIAGCIMDSSTIAECYNTGAIECNGNWDSIGGIVGVNYASSGSKIEKCYNTAPISGDDNIGGIVGTNNDVVENCYNTGAISGDENIGGIAGDYYNGTLENCYNTGAISGNEDIGGIAGDIGSLASTLENCYYLGDTPDSSDMGTVKSKDEFKSGEVALLLQDGQTGQVWGQHIPGDESPVLTNSGDLEVVKFPYDCTDSSGKEITIYTNPPETTAYLPAGTVVMLGGVKVTVKNGGTVEGRDGGQMFFPEGSYADKDGEARTYAPEGGGAYDPVSGIWSSDSTNEPDDSSDDSTDNTTPPPTENTPPAGSSTPSADNTTPPSTENTTPAGSSTPSAGNTTPPSTGSTTSSTRNNTSSTGNNSNPSTGDNTDPSDGISADDINVGSAGGENAVEVTIGKDSVDTLKDEIIASHLTSEDKAAIADGNKLDIILSAEDAADSVSDADIQAAEAVLDGTGYIIGRYLNLDLLKQIKDQQVGKITELDSPITLVYIIPEELRKENRIFAVVRILDGEAKLFEDTDNDPNTITVVTDRFYTDIIVYKDLDAPDSVDPASGEPNSGEPASGNPNSSDTTSGNPVSDNSNTGMIILIAVIILACAVIVAVVIVKKKKNME